MYIYFYFRQTSVMIFVGKAIEGFAVGKGEVLKKNILAIRKKRCIFAVRFFLVIICLRLIQDTPAE